MSDPDVDLGERMDARNDDEDEEKSEEELEFESWEEDIRVQRDSSGDILPVKMTTFSLNPKPVIFYPMPSGVIDNLIKKYELSDAINDIEFDDLPDEMKAEVCREWIARPEFPDDLDAEKIKESGNRNKITEYVSAVFLGSGPMSDQTEPVDEEEDIKNKTISI